MEPFSKGPIGEALRDSLDKVLCKIEGLDTDYVLKASPTELEQHFIEGAQVEPLVLHADQQNIEGRGGTKLDVSGGYRRVARRGERVEVQGTRIEVAIPFEGARRLWEFRPSRYTLGGYPEIVVRDDSILLVLTFPDDTADGTGWKKEIDRCIAYLAEAVAAVHSDVTRFNGEVPAKIVEALAARRKRALAVSKAIEGLGIPIKRRTALPAYVVPLQRRRPPVSRPAVTAEKYAPEPALPEPEYQYILGVTRSMGVAMERMPKTFTKLDEDSIRNFFLLLLNGHYEGAATGETFNAEGKTDIFIRVDKNNVFIAECKFWRGAKSFDEAVTQLLGYLAWRDTKCALLVFNRTRDSSAVAEKMHEVMKARNEFRKCVSDPPGGDARYIFVKESDPGREIIVTTQLFDVPGEPAIPGPNEA